MQNHRALTTVTVTVPLSRMEPTADGRGKQRVLYAERTARVTLWVDVDALAYTLGRAAAGAKGGKAQLAGGLIVAKVFEVMREIPRLP